MHISIFFCTLAVEMNIRYIIENSDMIWEKSRWKDGVKCPFCGCIHYYKTSQGKYKCKECGKIYTSTTNTLLHSSKLKKWQWITAIYQLSINKNISIRELAKTIGINKNSAYIMLQKIKYNLSQEDINMIGETIIDETYIGGWVNKHLSYKWEYMRKKGFVLPTQKKYTKTQILRASSDYKQHVIAMIDEEGKTKLLHLPNPITKECIKYVLKREIGITGLVCDESKLYENCGLPIETNNHSRHQWLTATGKSSNAVENRFSNIKRKIQYNTHTSEKYLQLHLNYFAWQVNYSGKSVEDKFNSLMVAICKKKVTNNDLFNFDYKKDYPKSRREIKREEIALIQKEIGELGIVLF